MTLYIIIWDYQLNTSGVCPRLLFGEHEVIVKYIKGDSQ